MEFRRTSRFRTVPRVPDQSAAQRFR